MKYKISEVSNILNIPIDTIRYYEKKNIVHPQKNSSNNYRFYDAWDINYLLECKKFRHYDFSLSEVEDILYHDDLSSFIDKINGRQNYFEEKMKYYTLLKKKNEEYTTSLNDITKNLNKFTFTYRPEIYYFLHRYNDTYAFKDHFGDIFEVWLDYFPFVETLVEIQEDSIMNRDDKYSWGFAMKKEYVDAFDIPLNNKVKHQERVESIYTVICAGEKGSFSLNLLDDAMAFIKRNGYRLSGTITGNPLLVCMNPMVICDISRFGYLSKNLHNFILSSRLTL